MPQNGSGRRASSRKFVLGGATLLALSVFAVAVAVAEPVQQFSVQLKDLTADGRYSVVYTSNAFDTTGEAPPALNEASLRLAKGMTIRKEFLKPDRLCDIAKFTGYLFQKRPKGTSYAKAVDDFPKGSARIERQLPKSARPIVSTCRDTFLGRGTAVVDGRPRYPAPIPAKFSLFLTKPTAKGAIAGIGVVSHYDKTSPIAVNELRYTLLQPIFVLNVFNDPTPDGLYGYRVRLLTERTSGFRFSVAELRVESKGIVGRTSRGPKDFWATPPTCPSSGEVPFKAEFEYVGGLKGVTAIKVPCPRFRR
jgi:hypothetical protein